MKDARQLLVKNGVHIGTQRKVDHMRRFIFKIREDGLAVMNVQDTIERLKVAGRMVSQYAPEDVLIVASKEQAENPAGKLAELAGVKSFLGRFMPGTMTNPNLEYFVEPKILVAADPYGDRQSITEAVARGIPIICLASTNNMTENIDVVIPCNNKGRRSLAAVYLLFTNYILYERGELKKDEELEATLEDFVGKVPERDKQE